MRLTRADPPFLMPTIDYRDHLVLGQLRRSGHEHLEGLGIGAIIYAPPEIQKEYHPEVKKAIDYRKVLFSKSSGSFGELLASLRIFKRFAYYHPYELGKIIDLALRQAERSGLEFMRLHYTFGAHASPGLLPGEHSFPDGKKISDFMEPDVRYQAMETQMQEVLFALQKFMQTPPTPGQKKMQIALRLGLQRELSACDLLSHDIDWLYQEEIGSALDQLSQMPGEGKINQWGVSHQDYFHPLLNWGIDIQGMECGIPGSQRWFNEDALRYSEQRFLRHPQQFINPYLKKTIDHFRKYFPEKVIAGHAAEFAGTDARDLLVPLSYGVTEIIHGHQGHQGNYRTIAKVREHMATHQIPWIICPESNELTGALNNFEGRLYPFRETAEVERMGVPIEYGTDDSWAFDPKRFYEVHEKMLPQAWESGLLQGDFYGYTEDFWGTPTNYYQESEFTPPKELYLGRQWSGKQRRMADY